MAATVTFNLKKFLIQQAEMLRENKIQQVSPKILKMHILKTA